MMSQQTKIVYRVLSLKNETPVYRVYSKEQAWDILEKCKERYPDKSFWLEEKKIVTSKSDCI